MTRSTFDAEDLVQEVLIQALESLDELEDFEYPRAWLLKVMYHRFIDERRRSTRLPIDGSATGADSVEPDDYPSEDGQPDALAEQAERVERVLRAMACLNADACALVAMHDVEGVSVDELSRLIGAPPGTIKARLHRTRKKLGRLLLNEAITKPNLRIIGGQE